MAESQTARRTTTLLGREYVVFEKTASNDHAFSLWDAGVAFCRYLEANPKLLRGFAHARVLEVGSGTGLVAMFLCAAAGAHVVATDLPHVIPHLTSCIASNGFLIRDPPRGDCSGGGGGGGACDGTITAVAYRWGDSPAEQVARYGPFAFIVGTDVVYDNELVRPLLRSAALFALQGQGGPGEEPASSPAGGGGTGKAAVVYFSNEERDSITHVLFHAVASSLFTLKEATRSRLDVESRDTPLHIYAMRLRRGLTAAAICAPIDLDTAAAAAAAVGDRGAGGLAT